MDVKETFNYPHAKTYDKEKLESHEKIIWHKKLQI